MGINPLEKDLQRPASVYVLINTFRNFSENILIISFTLYLLDTFNAGQVGILWGLYFGIIAILDYPTGALGDLIGYKTVFILAYLTKIGATIVVLFNFGFSGVLLFMLLLGVGQSQESGALDSWFDNLYNMYAVDVDRVNYSSFTARSQVIENSMSVLGLILGGLITTLTSIEHLIIWYMAILILIFFTSIILIDEQQVNDKNDEQEENGIGYFDQIKMSLNIFASTPSIFYYMVGTAFVWAVNESIWHTFISIRLYRDYTGSIAGAGIFRSIIFVSVIFWQFLVVKYIHKFGNTKFWLILSSFVSNSLFFATITIFYIFFPPTAFHPLFILGFFLIYQPPMMLESAEGVLRRKVELDLIPNTVRNSMYSLLPTLARILGVIFAFVAGQIIFNTNLIGSFIWLICLSAVGSIIFRKGILQWEIDNSDKIDSEFISEDLN